MDSSVVLLFISLTTALLGFLVYRVFFQSLPITYNSKHDQRPAGDMVAKYPTGTKHWTTEPSDEAPIFYAKRGPGAWKAETLFDMYERGVSNNPQAIEFQKEYLNPKTQMWEWKKWTRAQHFSEVKQAARAFIKLGLEPWHSVVCLGFNAPEWLTTNMGTIYAGGLIAGLYTTNNPGQCLYISKHCKANVAVVENEKQLVKFVEIRKDLKDLKAIVVWDVDDKVLECKRKANREGDKLGLAHVYEWSEFMMLGKVDNKDFEKLDAEMQRRKDNIKPGNCSTLIYTSGTTGPPKGVMLSHDNLTWSTRAFWEEARKLESVSMDVEHRIVSYLPLSHAAGQLLDIYYPMALRSWFPKSPGFVVSFARPDALRGSLPNTLRAVKPTIFFGVPRVWEKISEGIIKKARAAPATGLKKKLVDWAKTVGSAYYKNSQCGQSRLLPFGYNLANKLVFSKVKVALGFDKLQMAYTGAAPVQPQTLEFFSNLGINIYEAYGMSETSGAHTLCVDYHHVIGTVGITVAGAETMIDSSNVNNSASNSAGRANEGEICMRGRTIMMGYMYDPEKTQKAIDDQGFMHSGDIGEINSYGLLRITGRIKELVITAGGENIAPVPIEDYIKGQCPALSNIILIGDKKKYLSILVTVKLEQNLETLAFSNKLTGDALNVDSSCKTVQDAQQSEVWKNYIQKGIDTYNNDTEYCVSRAQRVQKFTILSTDFSVPGGTLTSTLKLKRPIIHKDFADEIASLY